jgi:hypothetical protein
VQDPNYLALESRRVKKASFTSNQKLPTALFGIMEKLTSV